MPVGVFLILGEHLALGVGVCNRGELLQYSMP